MQEAYAAALADLGQRRHPGQPGRLAHHHGQAARDRRDTPRAGAALQAAAAGGARGRDRARSPCRSCRHRRGARRRHTGRTAAADLHRAATRRWPRTPRWRSRCGWCAESPTADIARVFLVSEPTMAARITRAKKKIAAARIPYRVPRPAELPGRLRAVLAVIHLLFTAGHTAPSGASLLRADLVDRALHLARMLRELMPDETEVRGLLRAAAGHRRPPRDPRRRRRPAGAAGGPGPVALGPGGAGRGPRHDRRLPAGRPARAVRAAGRDRFAVRRGAGVRPDRLAADRRPVRPAAGGVAVTGRGAESRRAAGDGRRTRRPRSRRSRGSNETGGCRDTTTCPRSRPTCSAGSAGPSEAADAYRQALDLAANDAERAFLAEQIADHTARLKNETASPTALTLRPLGAAALT